jgi:hypothetical protein
MEKSSPTDHDAAWDELESLIAQMQQAASTSGLSPEQLDALRGAECAAVRYTTRPVFCVKLP